MRFRERKREDGGKERERMDSCQPASPLYLLPSPYSLPLSRGRQSSSGLGRLRQPPWPFPLLSSPLSPPLSFFLSPSLLVSHFECWSHVGQLLIWFGMLELGGWMYVSIYVYIVGQIHVCIRRCMYAYMFVSCTCLSMYGWMHARMYGWTHACLYVCMYK